MTLLLHYIHSLITHHPRVATTSPERQVALQQYGAGPSTPRGCHQQKTQVVKGGVGDAFQSATLARINYPRPVPGNSYIEFNDRAYASQ